MAREGNVMKAVGLTALLIVVRLVVWAQDAEPGLPTSLNVDGAEYEEVRWGSVGPSKVIIFHKNGFTAIPLAKLPPELQKKLLNDPTRVQQTPRRLARAETSTAIDRLILATGSSPVDLPPGVYEGVRFNVPIDDEQKKPQMDLRRRHTEFLELRKIGHRDYQPAIESFITACASGTLLHDELAKETPELTEAELKYQQYRAQARGSATNQVARQLYESKLQADAYFARRKKLEEETRKAWREALALKAQADKKE
jgi:hypothetical protein